VLLLFRGSFADFQQWCLVKEKAKKGEKKKENQNRHTT
jgi:hypothetical protein